MKTYELSPNERTILLKIIEKTIFDVKEGFEYNINKSCELFFKDFKDHDYIPYQAYKTIIFITSTAGFSKDHDTWSKEIMDFLTNDDYVINDIRYCSCKPMRDVLWSNFGGKPSSNFFLSIEEYSKPLLDVIAYGSEYQRKEAVELIHTYAEILRKFTSSVDIKKYIVSCDYDGDNLDIILRGLFFINSLRSINVKLNIDIYNLTELKNFK